MTNFWALINTVSLSLAITSPAAAMSGSPVREKLVSPEIQLSKNAVLASTLVSAASAAEAVEVDEDDPSRMQSAWPQTSLTIPAGTTAYLDQNIDVDEINIEGELLCPETPTAPPPISSSGGQ